MDKPAEDDDPTRVLDGWSPPAADPTIDPTRVLDGWRAQSPFEPRRPDPRLTLVEQLQPTTQADASPPAERSALPGDLDLHTASQRGRWDDSDVTDVEPLVLRSADFAAAPDAAADVWTPQPSRGAAATAHPRLLDQWRPQAWIGAVRRVFDSVAQVVATRDGPVVDTFGPHVLLALWSPQSPAQPFLDRWPLRVCLSAVPIDEAGLELLKYMPDDAALWLSAQDIDWAAVGEAVLLHEPGLRDFQLKELRAFVEAEKQANWDRANAAYRPGDGGPLQRA